MSEGARVVVGDIDDDALDRVTADHGDAVVVVHCDVTSENDVELLASTATDRFGRLDIAFANAGIGSGALIVDADAAEWRRIVDVCLAGPFLTIKHAAPRMTAGGSIVITTSLNAVQPGRAMSAYCAAKAGAAMLAQVAALELGSAGIRVNAVAPGLVRTGLTDGMWQMPAVVAEYLDNTPLGYYAAPDDIANVVAFLASDEARFVSGSQHLVDGARRPSATPTSGSCSNSRSDPRRGL